MHNTKLPRQYCSLFLKLTLGWLLSIAFAYAQAPGTGSISGHVLNPATGDYVRNASVRIEGTDLVTVTEGDGFYRFPSVPAGKATVTVTYTGHSAPPATLTVSPDQTATHDFNITATDVKTSSNGDVIKLDEFSVSAAREGNAKAIMQQRASMNISNVVASDIFGDIAEGNVGEFLKYMPGIQLDYVEADVRSPRLRGLPAQYTGVTIDGQRLASADAFIQFTGTDNGGGAGTGDRSYGFEQTSINSIESIQVDFTTNASQDADSPAGNIDLKTKRAFDKAGRRIAFQVNSVINSEQTTLDKTVGPDDSSHYKIRPGATFDYSDVFFNKRLGVVFNLTESNSYNEQRDILPIYSSAPTTATDTRPLVMTGFSVKDGPKFSERSSATFTSDFKATKNLTLSWTSTWNNYIARIGNRTFGFASKSPLDIVLPSTAAAADVTTNNALNAANARAQIGGDGVSSWGTTPVPVTLNGTTYSYLYKRTRGHTYAPTFEYRLGGWKFTGIASYSTSENNYQGGLAKGIIAGAVNPTVPGGTVTTGANPITVTLSRPSPIAYDTTVRQVGGPDFGNLANYNQSATTAPQINEDGRYSNVDIYTAGLNARYIVNIFNLPFVFQTGGKITEQTHIYRNGTTINKWNYVGPGGGLGGNFALYPSNFVFSSGHGGSILSNTGRTPAIADHNALASLYLSHPEFFQNAALPADLANFYLNSKYIREQLNAGYGMVNTKIKKLRLQGGLRWEQTRTETKDFDRLRGADLTALGIPFVVGTEIATTIPGVVTQFTSKPIVAKSSKYQNYFPSASAAYDVTPNLTAQLGFSHTITRPNYNDIAGVATFDDTVTPIVVTLPNTALKPQYANNFSAKLAYYFEPIGTLAVSPFVNKIANQITSTDTTVDASVFGGPVGTPLTLRTKFNLAGTTTFEGMTYEYSQSLSFLPKPFDGLNVFANYTRIYVKYPTAPAGVVLRPAGISPHIINAGVNYKYKALSLGANVKFQDVTPYQATVGRYEKQQTKLDLTGNFRITKTYSAFLQVRNVFNTPDYIYDSNTQQKIFRIEYYGAAYTLGVKGNF